MKQFRYFLCAILLVTLFLTAGCPQQSAELEVDQANITIEPGADDASINIQNTGAGELTWSLAADVEWITFQQDEGTGEAIVTAQIDRGALSPLTISRANIIITSSGGNRTIPVVVASAVAGLDPAYMPMQVGNVWRFGTPAYKDGAPDLFSSMLKSSGDEAAMTWEVIGESTVNALTVWEIQIAFPRVRFFTPLRTGVENALEVTTYWVNVDGVWYITLDQGKLASLPDTASFISFVDFVKFPGKLMYLQLTDLAQQFMEDVDVVMSAADESATPFVDGVGAFTAMLMVDNDENGYAETFDPTPLFPLLNAFGAEFGEYQNDNPVLQDSVQLLAAVAPAIEPINAFVNNVKQIVEQAAGDLNDLPEPTEYDHEAQALLLADAFGSQFTVYENSDALIQNFVRMLATLATNADVLTDRGIGADAEALDIFYEYLSDDYLKAFEAIEAMKALETKAISDAVIGSYLGLEPADVDELIAAVADYESVNAKVNLHKAALIDILYQAKEVVIVLQTYTVGDFEIANLDAFTNALLSFANQYATDHDADFIAQTAQIVITAIDDVVGELVLVDPELQDILNNIDALLDDFDNPTEDILTIVTYKQAFGDLAAFFEEYAAANATNQDAPVASYLAVYLRAVESNAQLVIDLNTELDNTEWDEAQDSLSNLLPDWPYPMAMTDFGIANQADCMAAQIIIPEPVVEPPVAKEADTIYHNVAISIWARDLGLVMYGPLPLQSATVGGVEHSR